MDRDEELKQRAEKYRREYKGQADWYDDRELADAFLAGARAVEAEYADVVKTATRVTECRHDQIWGDISALRAALEGPESVNGK